MTYVSGEGVQKTDKLKKPGETNQTVTKISVQFQFGSVLVSGLNTLNQPKPNRTYYNIFYIKFLI